MSDTAPVLTDDVLSYQSKTRASSSRVSRAASNALMFTGGLTAIAGTCASGFLLFIESAFGGESSPRGPYGLAAMGAEDWLFAAILFLAPAAVGIAEMICGMKVRKRSTPAIIVGMVLVSVQTAAALVLGRVYYVAQGQTALGPGAFTTTVFVGTLVLAGTSLILLGMVLREKQRGPDL